MLVVWLGNFCPFFPSKDREQKTSKSVLLLSISLFVYDDLKKSLVSQFYIISSIVKVSDFPLFSNLNFFYHIFSFLSSSILTFELVTLIAHSPNMGRISKSSNFR